MLGTFDVPPQEGRVCFCVEGPSRWSVTVECPVPRLAFQFDVPVGSRIAAGDHVRISGKVRMNPGLRKDGSPVEKNLGYYHEPHDGSPRVCWAFFFLRGTSWERVAPPDVSETLREVLQSTQALLDGWDGVSSEMLQRTVRAWERASNFMRPVLRIRRIEEQDRNAPVKALDLEI